MKKYQSIGTKILMRPRNMLAVDDSSGMRKIGDIIIPDSVKLQTADGNPIMEFVVISAGPDCKQVKDGAVILVNGLIAERIPVEGGFVARIDESSVIAVIEEAPDAVAPANS